MSAAARRVGIVTIVFAGVLSTPREADHGRASSRILTGPVLAAAKALPERTGADLGVKITPGKRAYAIRVDDVTSLAGMVQPNSRVDIMVVIKGVERGRQVARLFMENVRVLAISGAPERARDGSPVSAAVASIEVTPQEAERLAIAAAQGALQLVLRGYRDPDSISVSSAASTDVLTDIDRSSTSRPRPPRTRR